MLIIEHLARGSAPSDPRTEKRRRCAGSDRTVVAAVTGPRAGRIMSAKRSPASGSARLPLVVPGLGGGRDGPSPRGHRGGAGPHRNKVEAAYACACLFTMLLRVSDSGPMETGRRKPFGSNCLLSRSWPGGSPAGPERRTAQPLTRLACGGYSGLFPEPGPAARP